MTPLDVIFRLGSLLRPEGHLVSARRGAVTLSWTENLRGDVYVSASATSAAAAAEELAEQLTARAVTESRRAAAGDEEDREWSRAVRAALVEIEWRAA